MRDGPEGDADTIPGVTAFPVSHRGPFGDQIGQVSRDGRRRAPTPARMSDSACFYHASYATFVSDNGELEFLYHLLPDSTSLLRNV